MKKRTLSLLIAALMLALCFAPSLEIGGETIFEESYAASDTKSDGTYAGTIPSLPNGIEAKAIEFAWPYGTDKSEVSYSAGAPVDAYEKGLQSAYGTRSGWGAAPKAGASCDVFVGTVVRCAGYEQDYPRGLAGQYTFVPNSSKFKRVTILKVSDYRSGDIVLFKNRSGGGHTCIYVELNGIGYFAEAHLGKYYGSLYRKAKVYKASDCAWLGVFRATGTCNGALARGQYSTNVKYLQQFLNWAGFDCGTPDGSFGPNTEKSVKAFQAAAGLTADGKVGSMTLAAARTYKKGSKVVSAPATTTASATTTKATAKTVSSKQTTAQKATTKKTTKKTYSGKWPTKTINKKRGDKTNIKRWQSFLKWYGYPMTTGGKFGSKTIKYTKKFQKANGLEADGSVGPKTLKKAKSIKK